MRRIRTIIAYDGTDYVGWQTQNNGIAVQEVIEKAIYEVTGQGTSLQGSGRTDSGVHARAQVAHFDTDVRMAADKFAIALNTHLPADIRVLYSEETTPEFHARFSAKEKQYRYFVQTGAHADVFTRKYALHAYMPLDLDVMNEAAALVVGTHDFSAFMSTGREVETAVRTVSLSQWEKQGKFLVYSVQGNGFLYNMVRILVGTMLGMGSGRIPADSMAKALSSLSRRDAGPTAPAHGLVLWRVKYPDFDTEEVLAREE
ncbi:MAG: tRNA pseudouridine(38-40) synthase TruA [Clostridia bacterium]|nr:tRNA pseudouridine(38-40) synthase TruA [Clostridia bacterium]